ncbi:MAG: IreB family regulatory phosphoprotein [Clostridia bacterium]|nr:IreB family regulatory phosphoprotein [Clostridia bacterium]
MNDPTIQFRIRSNDSDEMKKLLKQIYAALESKGYNPINQLVGYILSEDPTYITTHDNARSLVRRIDRDELLQEMLKAYLEL